MVTDVLGALATGGLGSIFGSLMAVGSSWLKARAARKQAEIDHKNKMEMLGFELDARKAGHGLEMDALRQQTSASGLIASINADAAIPVSGWAANVKAVFRPLLTSILLGISTIIFLKLLAALSGESNVLAEVFSRDELVAMLRYTVYTLVFSTATAVTWWFGDRALAPPSQK